jgi:Zn-dependent protease
MNFDLQLFILRFPAILLALTIHEYAHGWVAWRCGDTTARMAGRLTMNPVSHLDPFGAIMLLFGPFGWAKPVPVNIYNLKNPKRDIIYVSAAGPAVNILFALLAGYLYRLIYLSPWGTHVAVPHLEQFLAILLQINIGISFFNLLPIPPLDGSKILMGFLPSPILERYINAVRHVPMIFVVLICIEWGFRIPIISLLLNPIYIPYSRFFLFLIFGGKVMPP